MRDRGTFLSILGICFLFLAGIFQHQLNLNRNVQSDLVVEQDDILPFSPRESNTFDPATFHGMIAYNETFNTLITGQEPAGWTVSDAPLFNSVIQVTDAGLFGPNSLNVTDMQTSAQVEGNMTFPMNVTDGTFQFDLACEISSIDNVSYILSLQNQSYGNVISINFNLMATESMWNVTVNNQTGNSLFLPAPSTYNLSLVFNASIANLYVNDSLEIANITYSRQVLTGLAVSSGFESAGGSVYFDNLFLTRAPIVFFEDFNDDVVGEYPTGWNCWDNRAEFMYIQTSSGELPTPYLWLMDHQGDEDVGGWAAFNYPMTNGTIEFDVRKGTYTVGSDSATFWVKLQTPEGSDVITFGVNQSINQPWWNLSMNGVFNNSAQLNLSQIWHLKAIICNSFIDVFMNDTQIFSQIPYSLQDVGRISVQSEIAAHGDTCSFDNFMVVDNSTLHISKADDLTYIYGKGSHKLTWHSGPFTTVNLTYTILVNGTIIQTGKWYTSAPLEYDISPYPIGSYNISIVIQDDLGRQASDEVIITVGKNPEIYWAPGNCLVNEDFNEDILGNPPDNWIISDAPPLTECSVTDLGPFSTPHLIFKDNSISDKVMGQLTFPANFNEGCLFFKLAMECDGGDTSSYHLYLKNTTNAVLINMTFVLQPTTLSWTVIIDNNTITQSFPATPSIINVELYFKSGKINLFMNGVNVKTYNTALWYGFNKLTLESEILASGSSIYLDDIQIYVPHLMFQEDFENNTLGANPQQWICTETPPNADVSVADWSPYMGSKSLRMYDKSTTLTTNCYRDLPYGITDGFFEMTVGMASYPYPQGSDPCNFYMDFENATGSVIIRAIFGGTFSNYFSIYINEKFCGSGYLDSGGTYLSIYFHDGLLNITNTWPNWQYWTTYEPNNPITRIHFSSGGYDWGTSLYVDNLKIYDLSRMRVDIPTNIEHTYGTQGNITWNVVDGYSINQTYSLYLNGTPIQEGFWHPLCPIIYDLSPLLAGSYNFTFVATEAWGDSIEVVTIVNVSNWAPDLSNAPSDHAINFASIENNLTWIVVDNSTRNQNFTIYQNGSIYQDYEGDVWISSIPIVIPIDNLMPGFYNFTITVIDGGGLNVSDEVIIEVTNPQPIFAPPPINFPYEWLTDNVNITWTIIDDTILNPTYSIYRNGSPWGTYSNLLWSNGIAFNVSVSSLMQGIYNFTIIATDGGGHIVQHEVIVNVTNALPAMLPPPPEDLEYAMGSNGYNISWTFEDSSTQMPTFSIYLDGEIWQTYENQPWTPGNAINISVGGMKNGTYTFSIVLLDGGGGSTSDDVLLVVTNDLPTVIYPADLLITHSTTGQKLRWRVNDTTILQPTYTIYLNGSFYSNDAWETETYISVPLDGFDNGEYLFEIYIDDGSGVLVYDSVTVTVVVENGTGDLDPMVILIVIGVIAAGIVSITVVYLKKKHKSQDPYNSYKKSKPYKKVL